MAKEADITKTELRVSINCCDGCKRKVKKALQGVEGVLKTEIDPSLPKVTAVGIVDPKILIKRLQKAGKQAELWSSGNQSPRKEKKDVDMPVTKEKIMHECENQKSSDSCSCATDTNKESKKGGDVTAKKENVKKLEVIKNENPVPPQPEMDYNMSLPEVGNIRTQTQYCYMVEPYPITVPFYAIPSYATDPLPPSCYGLPHNCHQHETRVGAYFSDKNTVGCSVM